MADKLLQVASAHAASKGPKRTNSAKSRWRAVGTALRQLTVQSVVLQQHKQPDVVEDTAVPMRVGVLVSDSAPQIKELIIAVTEEMAHTQVEWVNVAELKSSTTSQVDIFMNSDVMIVDQTDAANRPFLSFQLGMRESITHGRNPSILLFPDIDPESTLRQTTDRYICVPYAEAENGELWHTQENVSLVEFFGFQLMAIQEALPVQSTKERRFLEGLSKARDSASRPEQKVQALKILEQMLASDPSMVTQGHLLDLLLTYRDLKEWENMIRLLNVAGRHTSAAQLPQVQYHIAFALNRRNLKDDRQRALHIVNKVCEQFDRDGVVDGSQDAWGLKGRIYKDQFIESLASGEIDYESCENAIEAYRRVFQMEGSFYGGVNLLTLLFASERYQQRHLEIEEICSQLNGNVARKGGIQMITDYWECASFFEVNVVGGLFALANQAAPVMYNLASANWMVETTMRNIQLIDKLRKQREGSDEKKTMDPNRSEFEYWCEFFLSGLKEDVDSMRRFPVLVQTLSVVKPCYVLNHPPTERDESAIELIEFRTGQAKRYPISRVANLKYINIETKPGFTDKRRATITCAVGRGLRTFTLCFPAEVLRCVFCELTVDGGYVASKDDEQDEPDQTLEWEFDYVGTERRMLGRGANATVYVGLLGESKEEIAVKEVLSCSVSGPPSDLLEEIRTIRHLQHKNIVKFLGCEQDQGVFRLLMESVPGGSLTSMLYKYGGLVGQNTFSHLVEYSAQILEALVYLHGSDIVHRDVKGDNVLVNMYSGTLKLADFGTSKRMAGLNPRTDTLAGTPWYMAPEVIQSDTHDYGREADIWSFGCTVWQMARGKPPLVEMRDPEEVMEAIGIYREHEEIPDDWPESLRTFLESCFEVEPKERPSADDLLRTSFITGMEEVVPPPTMDLTRRMSLSVEDMSALKRSPSVSTDRQPSLNYSRSLSREVSAGGTYIEPWTIPQKHREIIHKLVDVLTSDGENVVKAWRESVQRDSTIILQNEEATIQDLLAVLVLMLKQEENQDGWGSVSELEYRVKQLIPKADLRSTKDGEPDPPSLCQLKKTLLHLKPSSPLIPSFLVPILRNQEAPNEVSPHWIFYIEIVINKALNALIKRLTEICRGSHKGDKHKQKFFKRAKARARALSDAEAMNPDPRKQMQKRTSRFSVRGSSSRLQVQHSSDDETEDEDRPAFKRLLSNQEVIADVLAKMSAGTGSLKRHSHHHHTSPLRSSATAMDAELASFLSAIGVSQALAHTFQEQEVTFDVLINCFEKDDLKDLGLPIGPRTRIWSELKRIKSLPPDQVERKFSPMQQSTPTRQRAGLLKQPSMSADEHTHTEEEEMDTPTHLAESYETPTHVIQDSETPTHLADDEFETPTHLAQ